MESHNKKKNNTDNTITQFLRKMRERELYVPEEPINSKKVTLVKSGDQEREDFFLYQLLEKYAIKIKSKVYGRPSLRLLQTLSSTIDLKNRTLSARSSKRAPNVFSFLPSTSTTPSPNPISIDSYKILFRAVRRALSESPKLFVFDSELPGSKTRIRLITDNIATAIWSKINLPPAPGLSKPFDIKDEEEITLHPLYKNMSSGHRNWNEFNEDLLVFVTGNLSDRAIYGAETVPRPTRYTSGGAAGGANVPGKAENKGQVAVGEFYNAIKSTKAAGKRPRSEENKDKKETDNKDNNESNKEVDDGNTDFVLENYQHKQVVVGLFEDPSNKEGPFVGGEQIRNSIRKVASYTVMRNDPDSFALPFADALLIQPKSTKSNASNAQEQEQTSPDYMNGKKINCDS